MKIGTHWLLARGEDGASMVEVALILPLFAVLLVGTVDFGRAIYLGIEVQSAAHAGAVYGSENPTDTSGMKTAAQDAAPNVPGLSVTTPTYGCECADGTNFSSSCSTTPSCGSLNMVYRVNVNVTGSYTPFLHWPGLPTNFSLNSSASMRSAGS